MDDSERRVVRPGASASVGVLEKACPVGVAGGERDPHPDPRYRALVGADPRYRALVNANAWRALPDAVRVRFSKRIAGGAELVYHGRVAVSWYSIVGGILVHGLRLIGGPLPLGRRVGTQVLVRVREPEGASGQEWTRVYERPGARRQVIRSVKQFGGPTGLEERVGCGVGMRLVVDGLRDGLVFRSAGYFWAPLGGHGIAIASWLTPGRLTVVHREIDSRTFDFELELVHPVFGALVRHSVRFEDAE